MSCEAAGVSLHDTVVHSNNATSGVGGGLFADGDVELLFAGTSTVANNSGIFS